MRTMPAARSGGGDPDATWLVPVFPGTIPNPAFRNLRRFRARARRRAGGGQRHRLDHRFHRPRPQAPPPPPPMPPAGGRLSGASGPPKRRVKVRDHGRSAIDHPRRHPRRAAAALPGTISPGRSAGDQPSSPCCRPRPMFACFQPWSAPGRHARWAGRCRFRAAQPESGAANLGRYCDADPAGYSRRRRRRSSRRSRRARPKRPWPPRFQPWSDGCPGPLNPGQ